MTDWLIPQYIEWQTDITRDKSLPHRCLHEDHGESYCAWLSDCSQFAPGFPPKHCHKCHCIRSDRDLHQICICRPDDRCISRFSCITYKVINAWSTHSNNLKLACGKVYVKCTTTIFILPAFSYVKLDQLVPPQFSCYICSAWQCLGMNGPGFYRQDVLPETQSKKSKQWIKLKSLMTTTESTDCPHAEPLDRSMCHTTCFLTMKCLLGVSFILLPILGV